MANRLRFLPVVALALSAAGCLQAETSHTLYLSPDGEVTWIAEQKGVRSDVKDLPGRQAEEDGYIASVGNGAHEIARGLAALGPDGAVKTHILRGERPFHVVTVARFDDIERLMQRLMYENDLPADVRLERDGGVSTLRTTLDFAQEPAERDSPAKALMHDIETYRFVLTDGVFLSGTGFEVAESAATFSKEWLERAEKVAGEHGTLEMVLTWRRQ